MQKTTKEKIKYDEDETEEREKRKISASIDENLIILFFVVSKKIYTHCVVSK